MPIEAAYQNKMHLLEKAVPGDWQSLGPFFADEIPYVSPDVEVSDLTIPGEVQIPARVFRPKGVSSAKLPALVWFHGGAFMGGDLDMGESNIVGRELAAAGIVVVSVDYRLCNDGVTFPAPQNDAVAAIEWVRANRGQLGVDRIFTGGASAGACLAGSTVQILRDKGLGQVDGALLIYPVAHAGVWDFSPWQRERLAELPPVMGFPDEFRNGLNTRVMGKPIDQSTGHDFPGDATFFGDLPDHLIVNCEYDDLAPSGEKYGLDLAHASVKVTMYTELGVLHGHINKNPNEVLGARNTLNNMIKFIEDHSG